MGQVMKVEELLRLSSLKERLELSEVKTLDAQRLSVLGHLRNLRSEMSAFQARREGDVEDGFYAFFRRLFNLLLDLAAAHQSVIGTVSSESMTTLWEIIAASETDLDGYSPNIAEGSSANQQSVSPCMFALLSTWQGYTWTSFFLFRVSIRISTEEVARYVTCWFRVIVFRCIFIPAYFVYYVLWRVPIIHIFECYVLRRYFSLLICVMWYSSSYSSVKTACYSCRYVVVCLHCCAQSIHIVLRTSFSSIVMIWLLKSMTVDDSVVCDTSRLYRVQSFCRSTTKARGARYTNISCLIVKNGKVQTLSNYRLYLGCRPI